MIWLSLLSCRAEPECEMLHPDGDGDGYGAGDPVEVCDPGPGYAELGGDCDDGDDLVHPGADEECDGVDDDCDGSIDEDAIDVVEWFVDVDGDGYGSASETVWGCAADDGFVATDDDCVDSDYDIHPDAAEIPYDGVDQDCDGSDLDDVDGDGSVYGVDCDDDDALRSPDFDEVCDDGVDNDCDDEIDDDCQFFGGVAPSAPAAVILGEDTSVACCGSNTGFILAGGDDLSGDGIPDLVTWSEAGGLDVRVLEGPFEGEHTTEEWEGGIPSLAAERYYTSIATGDFNGDGVADLALGEMMAFDEVDYSWSGGASVVLGPIDDAVWLGQFDATVTGERGGYSGRAIVDGDFDGDGIGDLAISNPAWNGEVHVVDGPTLVGGGALQSIATSTLFITDGAIGNGVAVGDLNVDGVEDLLVWSSRASLDPLFGSLSLVSGPIPAGSLEILDTASIVFDDAPYPCAGHAFEVAISLVDTLGTGTPATLLAAQTCDETRPYAWVFSGPFSINEHMSSAGATLSTNDIGYPGRIDADRAGDLDDDGFEDLVIGIGGGGDGDPWGPGRAYVVFGPVSGHIVLEEDAFGMLEGSLAPFETCKTDGCEHPGSMFGWQVVGGTDYTGDGHPDVVVGAPGFEVDTSSNQKGPGAVYIFSGQ